MYVCMYVCTYVCVRVCACVCVCVCMCMSMTVVSGFSLCLMNSVRDIVCVYVNVSV